MTTPKKPANTQSAETVQRQSVAWVDWMQRSEAKDVQSVVVVGSGYGGAVAALRYAEKGYAVTVLERGAEFLPGEFSNDMSTLPKFLRAPDVMGKRTMGSLTGLFDFRPGLGATAVVANGLGGGSLINAGVAIEPNPAVLTQACWPQAIRADDLTLPEGDAHSLRKAYDLARKTLGAKAWPLATPSNPDKTKTQALKKLAKSLGAESEFKYADLTIDPARCTSCGDCASGCNVLGAKLTLGQTYLKLAMATGRVRIITRATVLRLEAREPDDPKTEWVLRVLPTEEIGFWPTRADADRQAGIDLFAQHVVLCAGTFGSTEILQRSKAYSGDQFLISPSLGNRFSANGDNISFLADTPVPTLVTGQGAQHGFTPPGVEPCGPTITGMIDLRHNAPSATKGGPGLEREILVQDGAIPGAIARLFKEALSTAYTARQLSNWRWRFAKSVGPTHDPLAASQGLADHTQVLLTMGHDQAAGSIVRVEGRDESVPFWPNPADAPGYVAQQDLFDRISKEQGQGIHLHMPTWRFFGSGVALDRLAPVQPTVTTVHPLGGCVMGDYFETSVVNDQGLVRFEVNKTYNTLRVLDASIIPTSLGANPFLTITALAERAMTFVADLHTGGEQALDVPPRPFIPVPTAPQHRLQPVSASITEAQDCDKFVVRGALAKALGVSDGDKVVARFELRTKDADWLDLWDDAAHRLTSFKGDLSLTTTDGTTCKWTLDPEKGTFTLLPVGKPNGPLRRLRKFDAVLTTWLIVRYLHDWRKTKSRAAPTAGARVDRLAVWMRNFQAGALTLWHASEERDMHYDATLVLKGDNPAAPARLKLIGKKHVDYAATRSQLRSWQLNWLMVKLFKRGSYRGRFDLRLSFAEQLTNPYIAVFTESDNGKTSFRKLGSGHFRMDIPNLLKGGWFESAPLFLNEQTDLANGLQALGAYPALLARFALKTRLADVRLPDYGHELVLDTGTRAQVELRLTPTVPPRPHTVQPTRYALIVPRGETSVDDHLGELPDHLTLALWRYRRPGEDTTPDVTHASWNDVPVRKVKSILLLHAFGQSGYTFTTKSMPQNMAEAFYEKGWEVWVLDHRISTRLGYAELPSTIDQVGQIDVPAAVDKILAMLAMELDGTALSTPPLQIHAFAQCIGGAALAAGLLAGKLNHAISRPSFAPPAGMSDTDAAEAQKHQSSCLPKLASVVISQTHPFLVGTPITQAKTWVPALIRSAFKRFYVPFAVREPVSDPIDLAVDTLFASLPVPAEERCPAEKDYTLYESACVTCKRIRFIEAPLFKHSNLSDATHEELPLLFGPANVHLFAQASRMVKQERLCSEDGFNVYATVANLRQYAALPIVFMHGLENELFDAESAQRSAKRHFDAHPQWAKLAASALPSGLPIPASEGKLGSRVVDRDEASATFNYWWIKGYGHLDPIIGKQAADHVFAPLCRWFDAMQQYQPTNFSALAVAAKAVAKLPRCGPFMSNVRLAGDLVKLTVTFLIDDQHRHADGGTSPGQPDNIGRRVWPVAAVTEGTSFRLQVKPFQTSSAFLPLPGFENYLMAYGDITIPKTSWDTAEAVSIKCFSVHETLVDPKLGAPEFGAPKLGAYYLKSLTPQLIADLNGIDSNAVTTLTPSAGGFSTELLDAQFPAQRIPRAKAATVKRPSVSALRQRKQSVNETQLSLRASAWRSLDIESGNPNTVIFAATCCRYPSYGVDAVRAKEYADEDFKSVIGSTDSAQSPAFVLLVGDQIYADASGGLVDPLSPIERFFEKHLQAFGLRQGMGEWLAQMPTYMTPDDHEFIEGYPNGRPVTMLPGRTTLVNDFADRAARDAVNAFQLLQQPSRIGNSGSYKFSHGPARFFVLDTRTERDEEWTTSPARRLPTQLLSSATLTALLDWLTEKEATTHLNCIVSGSVLVPGLVPDSNPAYAARPDGWQRYATERARVMGALSDLARRGGKFLLLSGDYHMSAACGIVDSANEGQTVGAAVVMPPLYAPLTFLNSSAHDIWMDEPLAHSGGNWQLSPQGAPQAGSGIANVTITRVTSPDGPNEYSVTVAAKLKNWGAELEGSKPWSATFRL